MHSDRLGVPIDPFEARRPDAMNPSDKLAAKIDQRLDGLKQRQ